MKKIHNKDDVKINKESGQTAMELAVFGSIFIFTMGLIVRTALGYGYQQGQTLKAMRMAMRMSYMYSSGQMGSHGDNNASRNSATVVLIEDRLTSSSAKYGTVDRVPYMLSGAATHSRNLFLNIDSNEDFSLSVVDYWINGQRFPFSNARFINVPLNNGNPNWDPMCARTAAGAIIGCVAVYEKIPNHDGIDDWDAGCDVCFDLNRDGTSDEVPAALRPVFSWQWKVRYAFETKAGGATLLPGRIAMETEQVSYDVDGDYQEETVYSSNGSDADGVITSLHVIDYQEGDLDSSWQPGDPGEQPGIQRDTEVFTFLRGQRPGEEGTYAIVEEGRLYAATPGRQFIRTAKKKDQVDIIQREIQLSNFIDGRFCNADLSVPAFVGDDTSVTNPVEVCVRTRQACFGGNMPFTCMAIDDRYIFVRSRIADRRGHKWVTDTTDEPYVEFMR